MMIENITISKVLQVDEKVIDYIKEARKVMFPMLNHNKIPDDIQEFSQFYIENPQTAFFKMEYRGEIIGIIGMMRYDFRFPSLEIPQKNVVEVARLYIDPRYRRRGLAQQLFSVLRDYAVSQQVDYLYLHTHYFLVGATDFWLKQGFSHLKNTMEGDFETIHFIQKL